MLLPSQEELKNALTYGKDHPYGEFITKESVKRITLDDVKKEYSSYFRPNNAYLVIIGDIKPRKVKKTIKKLFGDWEAGAIPSFTMPGVNNVATTEINFIDMPNAVQSEIAVINTVNLTLGDQDYFAALLANQILGGGGTARLFQNLRETKPTPMVLTPGSHKIDTLENLLQQLVFVIWLQIVQ